MQKIRFTYTSSEIEPSVFLLLFFRMVGVYVYEVFWDFPEDKKKALLHVVDKNVYFEKMERTVYDLDLYYAATKDEFERAKELSSTTGTNNSLFIIAKSVLSENEPIPNRTVVYGKSNLSFLKKLLQMMLRLDILDELAHKQLAICGNIYVNNQLCKLTLKSKYFYSAKDPEEFHKIMNNYKRITDSLIGKIVALNSNWGADDSYYIQFAVLNIAYEGNQYCIRNKKSLVYDSFQLVELCEELLDNSFIAGIISNSIILLIAQLYDDTLKDPNTAYRYYETACKEYNAYAFFKKGCYWQDYEKNFHKAINYFSKSVMIYPEYYRAWYRMGNCYVSIANYEKALKMFRNVAEILSPRLESNNIRSMEIEYLFKAYNQCGFIWNKVYNNKMRSMMANIKAVRAWNAIDKSNFVTRLLGEDAASVRERTKDELNVDKINLEILKLADKMKNSST